MGMDGIVRPRPCTPDEIADGLARLRHWTLVEGSLQRIIGTGGFKATLLATMAVGHLCEAAWHHPEMVLNYDRLVIRLQTHSARAVTARDLELAAKIDVVLGWRPGEEGGALTGTPADPRHAYISRDPPNPA